MASQTESYKVLPSGDIESGNVSYLVDLSTGMIKLTGQVIAKLWFITKTVPINQSYPILLASLLSTTWNKIGDALTIGPATMTVTVIDAVAQIATVEFTDATDKVTGHAAIDLSSQYVKIISATALASVPVVGQITVSLQRC